MINFLVSIVLGLLPEVLYFSLFLIYTKNIKEKKLKLFMLLAIGYILLIMICRYQFIFYLAYVVYSYFVLKYLYKSQIIDFFICSIGLTYMTIVAYVGYQILGFNYVLYYIVARISLFSIFTFKKHFNKLYLTYRSLWNRNDNAKIKSLTIRNCSLLFINILILFFNFCSILCSIDSLKY